MMPSRLDVYTDMLILHSSLFVTFNHQSRVDDIVIVLRPWALFYECCLQFMINPRGLCC